MIRRPASGREEKDRIEKRRRVNARRVRAGGLEIQTPTAPHWAGHENNSTIAATLLERYAGRSYCALSWAVKVKSASKLSPRSGLGARKRSRGQVVAHKTSRDRVKRQTNRLNIREWYIVELRAQNPTGVLLNREPRNELHVISSQYPGTPKQVASFKNKKQSSIIVKACRQMARWTAPGQPRGLAPGPPFWPRFPAPRLPSRPSRAIARCPH